MTQLLISVRDVDEAIMVSRYPIGILDLKEPSAGALGAVALHVGRHILAELPAELTKSIALGELTAWMEPSVDRQPDHWSPADLAGFQFAKIGLAGMEVQRNWEQAWLQFQHSLPATVELVGVAYVDAAICRAPAIEAVLDLLQSQPQKTLLLDTFCKDGGTTLEILGERRLRLLIERARANHVRVVIAGSVSAESLPLLLSCEPDLIGVRGAVCLSGRANLDQHRLREFMGAWQACNGNKNHRTEFP